MINIAMIACILYESIAMELVAAGGVNQKSDGKRFVDSILEGIVFHLAIQRLIWRGASTGCLLYTCYPVLPCSKVITLLVAKTLAILSRILRFMLTT